LFGEAAIGLKMELLGSVDNYRTWESPPFYAILVVYRSKLCSPILASYDYLPAADVLTLLVLSLKFWIFAIEACIADL